MSQQRNLVTDFRISTAGGDIERAWIQDTAGRRQSRGFKPATASELRTALARGCARCGKPAVSLYRTRNSVRPLCATHAADARVDGQIAMQREIRARYARRK